MYDSISSSPPLKLALKMTDESEKMRNLSTDEASGQPFEEVAARLQVDLRKGLEWSEADSRLRFIGYNEFAVKKEEPLWAKYLEQFKNPLILLLLVSALVSVCMQQFDDAASIAIVSIQMMLFDMH